MRLRWSSQSHQPSGLGLRVRLGVRLRVPWRIHRHGAAFAKLNSWLQIHQRRKKRNRRRVGETDRQKENYRLKEGEGKREA